MPHSDWRESSSRNSNERNQTSQGSFCSDPQNTINPALNELRLVLLGKTGAGKSATRNTILGNRRFDDGLSMSSVTKECKRECVTVEERELVLVDTPGFFDTDRTDEELTQEVIRCLALCSPGPHAFLLVIPIERFTEEQQRTVEMILEMFHEDVTRHTILIFSHADRLGGESIEEFISKQNQKVQELVERFGRRFMAFDNTNNNTTNRDQVSRLLERVDKLLAQNENRHYTSPITEVMQEAQKIIEKKMQADMAEKMKKIEKEVKKLDDDQCCSTIASMNEERQDIERKRKRIQGSIDRIEKEKEEQNARLIPERLEPFRASLKREQENMRRLEEREMEEEAERMEREWKEKKDRDIWIQEDEQRRWSQAGQNNELLSKHKMKLMIMLTMFMLGVGVAYAPALLAALFPAAPTVEVRFSAEYLARLLGFGGARSGRFFGTVAGAAVKAASVKLAALTRCSIQ